MGETVGDALANAITLIDGLVVIGGGLSAAAPLFLPRVVAEMNGTIETLAGQQIPRMEMKAFNLEDEARNGRRSSAATPARSPCPAPTAR